MYVTFWYSPTNLKREREIERVIERERERDTWQRTKFSQR